MRQIKWISLTVLIILISAFTLQGNSFFTSIFTRDKVQLLPVPNDYRNYFFLQSIDDETHVIIGDFTGAEKFFSQIIDKNSDNTIDSVYEYFPDSKKAKRRRSSSSKFITGIEDMKMVILSGKIFRNSYSYKMKSLPVLEYKLKDGTDYFPSGDGHSVKFYDPDEPTTIMSEFYFAKKAGRYDLIFKTNYYKLFKMKIKPPIPFSVYCRNSKDPVVAKTVESLLKLLVK